MPKLNTGLPWEQAYRLEARQIIKGLSISANGKRSIKSTQIFWKRSDTSGIRTEYVSSIRLPWKEEAVEENLNFIKEAVERSLDAPELTFKQHLEDTLIGYANRSLTSYTKIRGIMINPLRGKINVRLRKLSSEENFDKAIQTSLLWDKAENHTKVLNIINESIIEMKWKPYNIPSMKKLYVQLYSKLGHNIELKEKYEHIKTTDLILEDDSILLELRLIRNYLEKLTLLQEVK